MKSTLKRNGHLLLIAFCALILTSLCCKKPEPPAKVVTPCFTIVDDNFRDPRKPVQFQNCSEGATSYVWLFGDATTSTEASPAHTYAALGEYTVQLTAMNGSVKEITTRTIRVEYPRFKEFRILQMPVLNRHGIPFDQDGSGLELAIGLTKDNDHSANVIGFASNMTLPCTVSVFTVDNSIEAWWWTVLLESGSNYGDTVLYTSRNLSQLMDAPVEVIYSDSMRIEIVMEGVK